MTEFMENTKNKLLQTKWKPYFCWKRNQDLQWKKSYKHPLDTAIADYIIESTGIFTSNEAVEKHLIGGAKESSY